MKRKSAREVRSIRRHATRTRSWTKKGLRSKRVAKIKGNIVSSPSEQVSASDSQLLYTHIECNEFIHRGHKQLVDDDIPVCSCKLVKGDSESACGDRCLNFLTSNECTPGFCPCGETCKNQRFQQRRYINSKLVKTEERGWGLLAAQDVKMGEFVIEYCGEVISCEEARTRSQTYEVEGLQDAYIISLSGSEFIDATRKGSLGRFINHSCDPNCETRKWTVLGEVRVGIFAKKDIKAGTELTYNYNFEWYGGAKVRCRCGATSCVGFLGAKSRGFQEDTYVWDDNDDRFSVENVPLYDSEDDEPLSSFFKKAQGRGEPKKTAGSTPPQSGVEDNAESLLLMHAIKLEVTTVDVKDNETSDNAMAELIVQQEVAIRHGDKPIKEDRLDGIIDLVDEKISKGERTEERDAKRKKQGALSLKRVRAEKLGLLHKRARLYTNQYSNTVLSSHVKAHSISKYVSSERSLEALLAAEEAETAASLELSRLHDKLRPTMEDLGKDGPDSLPVTAAEEWIALTCKQMAAVFNFNFTAIRSLPCFSPDTQQT
ncbi:hypothetical protein GOP47_0024006 [Adiantum capillus-veneris]|uniref:Histone-lysine N-methyltransferase ASHH1 n=1 Tax=Adiantum capillus-veneris TaxID=13818 RepID=A0A9D4U740_ADICA|nr:hypothetical protein GOP47_0024006 [Adiantum capillus-veneris]